MALQIERTFVDLESERKTMEFTITDINLKGEDKFEMLVQPHPLFGSTGKVIESDNLSGRDFPASITLNLFLLFESPEGAMTSDGLLLQGTINQWPFYGGVVSISETDSIPLKDDGAVLGKITMAKLSVDSVGISDYDSRLIAANIPLPLKQIKLGISPEDVLCRPGLELIQRTSSDKSVCLTPSGVEIFVEKNLGFFEN